MIHTTQYTTMEVWELAARHSVARDHRDYPQCSLIQQEVEKRPPCDRYLISRLKYYVPVDELVLFNKK